MFKYSTIVKRNVIEKEVLIDHLVSLWKKIEYDLPPDVVQALKNAWEKEETEFAKATFKLNLERLEYAKRNKVPFDGDTGRMNYYVLFSEEVLGEIRGGFRGLVEALNEAVLRATEEVPLRPNAEDPLTGFNPSTNVGGSFPNLNYRIVPNMDYLEVTAVATGGGPMAMGNAYTTLKKSEGVRGIKRFILDTIIARNRGISCTNQVVGVCIGGEVDTNMTTAQAAALLRPIGDRHPREDVRILEEDILSAANSLKIGPWGFGGNNTILDVHIEVAYTHPGLLPVGIHMTCPAIRRGTLCFYPDGKVLEIENSTWFKRLRWQTPW
jgi:tartrate/fumarate subfamily iron-sulfur-dependent hydro-lyase alpha chain